MVFKKGQKSHALRLLGMLLGVMALAGIIGYSISSSTEQTNKVSFKAAGVQYKQQLTVTKIASLPDGSSEEKQRKNLSSSLSVLDGKSQNSTNKNRFVGKAKQVKSLNTSLIRAQKQPEAKEIIKMSLDLQVLSSFDCVKSIPTVLVDYISTMFRNEYGRSHKDFHSEHKIDETIPQLEQFNINCGVDQNCSALFQYDKQYSLNTTADKTYFREDIFYCCPSVHSWKNETTSKVCKRAQAVAGKSVFRESKDPTFLKWVTKPTTYVIFLMKFCISTDTFQLSL